MIDTTSNMENKIDNNIDNVISLRAEKCRKFLNKIFDEKERPRIESKLYNIFAPIYEFVKEEGEKNIFNPDDIFSHLGREGKKDFVSRLIDELSYQVGNIANEDNEADYYTKITEAVENLRTSFVARLPKPPKRLRGGNLAVVERINDVLQYIENKIIVEQEKSNMQAGKTTEIRNFPLKKQENDK